MLFLSLLFITGFCVEWENTVTTTNLWRMVSSKENYQLATYLVQDPTAIKARSEDGRGVMWWAWEYGNIEALSILKVHGGSIVIDDEDAEGNKPHDLAENYEALLAEAESMVPEATAKKAKIEEYVRKTYEAQAQEQAATATEDYDDEADDDTDYYDDDDEDEEIVDEEIAEEDLSFDWDENDEDDDEVTGGDEFHDEL